ncbi:MAG TPA: tetratricopeptide repeat protein [Myxococcaceae bacterium]|nr:tetratricopeptide repeat protein [Myxococcaceae bacterium]
MEERIPRQRAAKIIAQAHLHLGRGEHEKARELAQEVVARSDLPIPAPFAILGEALFALGRKDEALSTFARGLEKFPKDGDLTARMAMALGRSGRFSEALPLFERTRKGREREPTFLAQFAYVLGRTGQLEEAERLAIRAASGGSVEGKVVLGFVRSRRGQYPDAEKIFAEVERDGRDERVVAVAKSARADVKLLAGDAEGALSLWRVVRAAHRLDDEQLAHMAYAAAICGDQALCDELVAQRSAKDPTAEDLLLFAQISALRGRGEQALRELDASAEAPGERQAAYAFEVEATRGRALRLVGRTEAARQVLGRLAQSPEAASARLGAQVQVDLGHLESEAGDFDAAVRSFAAALALDPGEPEAKLGLAQAEQKLPPSRTTPAEAARAEAEAMRRRFTQREGEIEKLKRELDALAALKRDAERKAREAERLAREATSQAAAVEAGSKDRLRQELAEQETEIENKARENLDRALGRAAQRCPPSIVAALEVAERTFQKSLYTDLPAAAVAVLYTGALERALYTFFVERFGAWLQSSGRREELLTAAIRERRGSRVEYFDYFVEAFDEERPGRAPSMGEVGRVLERRHDAHLKPFLDFLASSYPAEDRFYDSLARFVAWSKEEIRDPVAHGRLDTVGYEKLKEFRERFLFALGGSSKGALAGLLGSV